MQLAKRQQDLFENKGVIRAIFSIALPSIISQIILVFYNMADTFFIGMAAGQPYYIESGLGPALVSGVTICMPIYMLLSAISNLFGIGAASLISRSLGKRQYERARNASQFAIYGCLFTTIIYVLLTLAILNPLTSFISGNNVNAIPYARTYILWTVVICGIPTALNTLFSHLIRAEGKSFHASIGIALGGLLNVALDPLFIFVAFDIKDAAFAAALATGLSNVIALIYYIFIFILIKKGSFISFKFKRNMFSNNIPKEVLIIGLPACLMTLCENISYLLLDFVIGSVSSIAIVVSNAQAGIGVAKKVNMLAHSIARGMSQGVLPLIGYNKSSGNHIRMKKVVYASGLFSFLISIICMILCLTVTSSLCKIFLPDNDVLSLNYACLYLRILCIGAPFSALAYTIISFFQAVGKGWRSLLLALLRKGLLDIPLMFILNALILTKAGEEGMFAVWATPIADIFCFIIAIILFFIYIKKHNYNKIDIKNNYEEK